MTAKHQPHCDACGHPAKVTAKWNPRDSDTWSILTCDQCFSNLCDAHAVRDINGAVVCSDCAAIAKIETNQEETRP